MQRKKKKPQQRAAQIDQYFSRFTYKQLAVKCQWRWTFGPWARWTTEPQTQTEQGWQRRRPAPTSPGSSGDILQQHRGGREKKTEAPSYWAVEKKKKKTGAGRSCPVDILTCENDWHLLRLKVALRTVWLWAELVPTRWWDEHLNLFGLPKHNLRSSHTKFTFQQPEDRPIAGSGPSSVQLTLGVVFQVGVMPLGVCQLPPSPQVRRHVLGDPPGLRTRRRARVNTAYQEYPGAVSIIAFNPSADTCVHVGLARRARLSLSPLDEDVGTRRSPSNRRPRPGFAYRRIKSQCQWENTSERLHSHCRWWPPAAGWWWWCAGRRLQPVPTSWPPGSWKAGTPSPLGSSSLAHRFMQPRRIHC